MAQKQIEICEIPQQIVVHVERLTREYLLAVDGNPAKTYLLGSNQLVLHLFSMAANRIVSMDDEVLPKAAEHKVPMQVQRPLAFASTPIARSCLHEFGKVLDAHANSIINRQLEVMMLTLKPGTAASQMVKMYAMDEYHLQTLKMRAYRIQAMMMKKLAKNTKNYT